MEADKRSFLPEVASGIAGCLVDGAAESNTVGPAPALHFRMLQSQLQSFSESLAVMIDGCGDASHECMLHPEQLQLQRGCQHAWRIQCYVGEWCTPILQSR